MGWGDINIHIDININIDINSPGLGPERVRSPTFVFVATFVTSV